MRRSLKITLRVVFIVAVAIVISIAALVAFVNPNDFKGKISGLVQQQTGRNLVIQGNISWKFFPWLGLRATDISLSNPQGFPVENFASIKEADISVKLLPLFVKNIEVGKLTLDGLDLHLIKDASGRNNWQDLFASNAKNTQNITAPAPTSSSNPQGAYLLPFSIANLEIKKANLSWEDRALGRHFAVKQLNFKARDINLERPFDFSLSFSFDNDSFAFYYALPM